MSAKADSLLHRFGTNIAQTVANRPGASPQTPSAAGVPDKYDGAVKARTFAEMPVEAIVCGPQPRTEFDPVDLRRLAESIKRFGQLAPIRVRHDPDRGAWIVLVGERRLRACKLAGLERVRVEFVERDMTESDILAEQVVENAVRTDLQPVEQARAYDRLMTLNGWSAQQLAETLGIEPTGVYRSLALLRLPDDVAVRVDAGEIKPTAAYEISKLPALNDQREVANRVVAEGLDHKSTAAEVVRRRKAGAPAKEKDKEEKEKEKEKEKDKSQVPAEQLFQGSRGVRVTVQAGAKHTIEDLVADLREIANRLEATATGAG